MFKKLQDMFRRPRGSKPSNVVCEGEGRVGGVDVTRLLRQPEVKEQIRSVAALAASRHRCAHCGARFYSEAALWGHCQQEHDPDGIMYSEFGPK